jgi:4-amino-4-deoxy-L-arabinose transferase-like glycosyltransferase
MSTSLLSSGVLGYDGTPSTYYEPLYPILLAIARRVGDDQLLAVLVVQALIGAIGGVYLYELALGLSRSASTAAIATAMYAFYPYLVAQSSALEEVTLLSTLLVAAAYHYTNAERLGHSLACGVMFGLALLTRTAVLPIVLVGALALAARRRISNACVVGVIALLVYAPYAARNHLVDGSLLPTRSGFNFFKANCAYSEAVIPTYMIDVLNAYAADVLDAVPDVEHATEKEIDRVYTTLAFDFVRKDPKRSALRWLRNAIYLFYPRLVPFHPIAPTTRAKLVAPNEIIVTDPGERGIAEQVCYALSYGPIFVAALVGVFLRRRELERDLILYLIALSFAAVYSVSWPATRVRVPMDFVLIFFAASAVHRVVIGNRKDVRTG